MSLIPSIQTQQSPAAMTMRGRNIVSKEQRREGELLVSIMPIGSKGKYYNLGVVDFVNDPVLLGDTAAPLAISRQICAFNCTAVITPKCLASGCKDTQNK